VRAAKHCPISILQAHGGGAIPGLALWTTERFVAVTSALAVDLPGSCSTAASCSRLVDENGPASSIGGRGRASTWQLQLSHRAVRASTDEQRTGYARGVWLSSKQLSGGATMCHGTLRMSA
jgi:hypothetical protein